MPLLLRLMAVLLVLTVGGVFETLASALDAHAHCEDDAAGSCDGCCALGASCLCCAAREVPTGLAAEVYEPVPVLVPIRVSRVEPPPSGVGTDIFQPPRA
jgi:hypothetical protein